MFNFPYHHHHHHHHHRHHHHHHHHQSSSIIIIIIHKLHQHHWNNYADTSFPNWAETSDQQQRLKPGRIATDKPIMKQINTVVSGVPRGEGMGG
jgi:hypothetical protein